MVFYFLFVAQFVKTSTGFGSGGATREHVKLMKETVPDLLVKASGGIRSYEDAMQMIAGGADRLGVSSGIAIMKGAKAVDDTSAY